MHLGKRGLRDVSFVTRRPVACQWVQREQSPCLDSCRVSEDEKCISTREPGLQGSLV